MSSPARPDGDTPHLVRLVLNGTPAALAVLPSASLLSVLRDRLGLTGTKLGCERGECGACTVLLDDRPVYACLLLAVECEGRRVETIESLRGPEGEGGLHPVPAALIEEDGLQCGFCTPGQAMSLVGLLRRNPDPDREEILEALSGNLCRCGAYPGIVRAAERAARALREAAAASGESP